MDVKIADAGPLETGDVSRGLQAPADPSRRRVLAGLLTAYTASLIPWALAAPVADQAHAAFAALSAILVGRKMLDAGLSQRVHSALAAIEPDLDKNCQALLDLIDGQRINPANLQGTLDAAHSNLAALPRQLMRAWCLGVAGSGVDARCVAYEDALDAAIVADVLKPPTYAYGPYASWSAPPRQGHGDDNSTIG